MGHAPIPSCRLGLPVADQALGPGLRTAREHRNLEAVHHRHLVMAFACCRRHAPARGVLLLQSALAEMFDIIASAHGTAPDPGRRTVAPGAGNGHS